MKTCIVRAAVAALFLSVTAAQAASWRVVDLGANVRPRALNNSGTVVGDVTLPSTATYPFVWNDGVLSVVQPAGWRGGSLAAINGDGVAVGRADLLDPARPTAPFVYDSGVVSLLPVDGAGAASAINDAGVIGGSIQAGPSGLTSPFLWQAGSLYVLPTLSPTFGGSVQGINASGLAVGSLTTADGTGTVAFAADTSSFALLPGVGGLHTLASAINDHDVIVGTSYPGGVFASTLLEWQEGVAQDLGGVAGAFSTTGMDINNDGAVVGNSFGAAGAHGFLYRDGRFDTLEALLPGAGWVFLGASAINDRGDIAGFGIPPDTTQVHGFVLLTARTPEELAQEILALVGASDLRPSQTAGLQPLLLVYLNTAGANRKAVCNGLARFVAGLPSTDLPPAEIDRLRGTALQLAEEIDC